MESNMPIENLVAMQLAGQALSPQQAARLQQYARQQPQAYAHYKKLWELAHAPEPDAQHSDLGVDSHAAWARVKRKMAEPKATAVLRHMGPRHLPLWAIAASVLVAALVGWWLFFPAPTASTTVVASAAEGLHLHLPDGSQVHLQQGASLRYHPTFRSGRQVALQGQAFFEVVANTQKPFRIVTAQGSATVVGTEFLLAATPDSTLLQVQEGKVKLSSAETKEELLVGTGQAAASGRGSLRMLPADANAMAWHTGVLVFNNADLSRVAKVLKQAYGLQLQWDPAAQAHCRLSARFSQVKREKLADLLGQTMNLNHSLRGDTLILSGSCTDY